MTAPALDKTWSHNILNLHITPDNTQVNGTSDGTNDRKDLFLSMVNGWLTATGSAMTVTRSCDATTAADSNLWTDITKLRWNNSITATRSWIAFEHTALRTGGSVWILLDLVNNSGFDGCMLEMWVSVDGPFTGGSPTAQPTAPNQVQFMDGNTTSLTSWAGFWGSGTSSNVARAFVLQQQTSSDGQVSRTQIWLAGNCIGWWNWERMKLPQGLTYDFTITVFGNQSDTTVGPMASNTYSTENYIFGLKDDKSRVKYRHTMHDSRNSEAYTEFFGRREDGSVGLFPVGIWSSDGTWLAKWGDTFDLYWGQNDDVAITHLPNADDRDWLKIYDYAIFWNDNDFAEIR
jgi:hypothetical protein